MQYLLSLLPLLACPIVMGGMMWIMMRMGKEQHPSEAAPKQEFGQVPVYQQEFEQETAYQAENILSPEPQPSRSPSFLKTIWECAQMCLNWRVLLGIAVIAALVGIASPSLFLASLPVLLVLVCPISMGIMMLRMGKMRQMSAPGGAGCAACPPESTERPQAFEQPSEQRSLTSSGRW